MCIDALKKNWIFISGFFTSLQYHHAMDVTIISKPSHRSKLRLTTADMFQIKSRRVNVPQANRNLKRSFVREGDLRSHSVHPFCNNPRFLFENGLRDIVLLGIINAQF